MGSRGSSLIDYVIADTELFKYFSIFCVEDPKFLSDQCAVTFMLTFCVSCKKVEESVSSCTCNMTQDTCVTHECNGRYVWDNNKIGDFLIKLQSEDVKQQICVLNSTIKQVITNDEIDSTVDSFTTLIETVSSSFIKRLNHSERKRKIRKYKFYIQ